MIKKYTLLYILFMLLVSCQPGTDDKETSLSSKGTVANMRVKRSVGNQPQLVQITSPERAISVNKYDIPERARRHQLDKRHRAIHSIYYLPISSNNLTQENLDIIEYSLSLRHWRKHLPEKTYASRLYFHDKDDPRINISELITAPINGSFLLNFEDLNNPIGEIYSEEGKVVHSGKLLRDLVSVGPFSSDWNVYDLDISHANDIEGLSYPIKSGDTVHLLFIQVVRYEGPDSCHPHYYLNPINLDNLDLISYTIK